MHRTGNALEINTLIVHIKMVKLVDFMCWEFY